jgi:hypothetical protein
LALQDSKSAAAGCATAKGEVEAKLQAAHTEAAATLRSAESVQTASAAEVAKLRQEMDRVGCWVDDCVSGWLDG